MSLDPDFSPDEQEEKARLISQVRGLLMATTSSSSPGSSSSSNCRTIIIMMSQVLELQNTLDDLTHRVDKVTPVPP